ncbi:hypothetical protein GCM10018793_67860 [Streptomyces sulfonofaciens]|uniref:Secreted protein n=1 Tax=Streptomyces sulfonofaciens TaxID=68272 RepID=A0A919L8Z4_9ACTN|nr:ALF repeat-containing protein [Streptomyces sulfonofaciens]GHH88378.1 hypothetical protein GCM10018793_67860 [Streptomyces sulfonofaciens]
MRPTRAALLVAATAMAPALLLAGPAFAAVPTGTSTVTTATSGTPVDEMTEAELRAAIADILADDSGRAVVREAGEALNGTVEDMRAFLVSGYRQARFEDDLVAIARILDGALRNGDKAVIAGCNEALDAHTPETARAFRETGYRLAQAEDDAVYIARMLADPDISDALRAAANAVLDDGSPEALRYFRVTGQYEVNG